MTRRRVIDTPQVRREVRQRAARARERMLDAITRGDFRPPCWRRLLEERLQR